jgi:hypothetical protein
MTGVNVRGPLIPDRVDKAADPQDEQIKKNIEKSILDASHRFAKVISPNNRDFKTNTTIARGLRQNRGAKGAVRSAVGSAFEVATSAALGIKEAKVEKGFGDFDVRTSNQEKLKKLRTLFNIPTGIDLMDFKVSASKDNLKSFAKKIFNNDQKLRAKLGPPKAKGRGTGRGRGAGRARGRASGFIPRFAGGFTGKKIKNVPTQNMQPNLGGGGGGFSGLGKGFAISMALSGGLALTEESILADSREEVRELNDALKDYQETLDKIDPELDPKGFKQTSDAIESLTKKIEIVNQEIEDTSAKFAKFGNVAIIASYLAPLLPKGAGKKAIGGVATTGKNVAKGFRSPKAFGKMLGTPVASLAGRGGAAALGAKGLAAAGGVGTAAILATNEIRKFTEGQITESLNSVSDEDFSKKAVISDFASKLNPINAITDAINDEQATFGEKAKEIVMANSPAAMLGKMFALAGMVAAPEEEILPREQVLSKNTLEALERGDIREVRTPEEAEAERQRIIKERKTKQAKKVSEETATFGEFTALSDLPDIGRRTATFNRIGFGGKQSQISQMIASNQLNANIKDLSGMEQVEQDKKTQAKDVRLKRLQSSIGFEDTIKVFNRAIKAPNDGKFQKGKVTGAANIQEVEKARKTALEQGSLSRVLSDTVATFRQSSDPKALADAFEKADIKLDTAFKSGAISEEERDKFRTMLEGNLEDQSKILAQDVMDRKKLAIDSLRARVQAEEGIVNKLKASFESNLSKLDSNSSQIAADFSQTKTRSEKDQFLKNLGISDEGRYKASIADTRTAQFGQAAVAGAGTELRDYIKDIRKTDPKGAEDRLKKQFSSGQKQVLSEAMENSDIEGLKKRLFDLYGAKTDTGRSFTMAGVTGLMNNVNSAGLGDISSVADAERALNVLDSVANSIGQLSGTEGQTQAQNEIGVQIAAIKEKIEAGIGVAKVGIQEKQLEKLSEIAQNTSESIKAKLPEGGVVLPKTQDRTTDPATQPTDPATQPTDPATQPPDSATQPPDSAGPTAAQKAAKKRAEEEAAMGFTPQSEIRNREKRRQAEEDRIASNKKLQEAADKAEMSRLASIKESYRKQADSLKDGGDAVRSELEQIAESLSIVNKRMREIEAPSTPEAPPN